MIHYCFTLSEEQLKYLRSKKYKIDRMECFMSLVVLAGRETKLVQVSKTQQVEILPGQVGQVMVDNTQLAKLWNKDRKTVPKIIEAMEALGISSSQKIGENRIHTLHSLSGWYVDGKFRGNYYSLKPNAEKTAIVHADVPPARVITVDVSDDKSKGEEGSFSESDSSHNGNMGMNPSAVGNVSHPSPQSNDSGNVGKSGTDAASSESSHYNNSRQSAGIPSTNLTTTIPVSLLASLLRMQKPMAVRMKGKETREHHRSTQEVKVGSLAATRDSHITVTRSLTAMTAQTATSSHVD